MREDWRVDAATLLVTVILGTVVALQVVNALLP